MALEVFALESGSETAEITRRAIHAGVFKRASTPGSVSSGLLAAGDFSVATAGGMTVTVGAGELMLSQGWSSSGGGYYVRNTASISLSIAAADASNPRVDTIVARVQDSTYPSGGTSNTATVEVLAGTPTSGATLANRAGAATVTAAKFALAYVLVPAKASTVTIENVAKVCLPGLERYAEGVASARPVAGVTGRVYYATDTQAWSFDTGSTWTSIVQYAEGVVAGRPTFGVKGRVYYATDTAQAYWDTGSAWVALGTTSAAGSSATVKATGVTLSTTVTKYALTLEAQHAIANPVVLLSLLGLFKKTSGSGSSQGHVKVYVGGSEIGVPPPSEHLYVSFLGTGTTSGAQAWVFVGALSETYNGYAGALRQVSSVSNPGLSYSTWSGPASFGTPLTITTGTALAGAGSLLNIELEVWCDSGVGIELRQLEANAILIG
jgi:hypothetical protein